MRYVTKDFSQKFSLNAQYITILSRSLLTCQILIKVFPLRSNCNSHHFLKLKRRIFLNVHASEISCFKVAEWISFNDMIEYKLGCISNAIFLKCWQEKVLDLKLNVNIILHFFYVFLGNLRKNHLWRSFLFTHVRF